MAIRVTPIFSISSDAALYWVVYYWVIYIYKKICALCILTCLTCGLISWILLVPVGLNYSVNLAVLSSESGPVQ